MFVAMSRFCISEGMTEAVCEALRNRPQMVDSVVGFVRMEVLRPRELSDEFWLLTFWVDEASFRSWHRGHCCHESHAWSPKGVRLVPGRTRIEFFEHITD
jgi:heme oxygenase (mycobilin-producing)